MKWITLLFRFFNNLTKLFESAFLSLSIIAFTVIIFYNVITRYFFNYSWPPMEEIVKFIRIWVAFIGASYATRIGRHISMSAFFDMLPKRGKKIIIIIMSAFNSAVAFLLVYYGYQMTMGTIEGQQVSPALRLSLGPIYMAVPLGCFLMGIHFARNVVKNIREDGVYLGPEEEEEMEGEES